MVSAVARRSGLLGSFAFVSTSSTIGDEEGAGAGGGGGAATGDGAAGDAATGATDTRRDGGGGNDIRSSWGCSAGLERELFAMVLQDRPHREACVQAPVETYPLTKEPERNNRNLLFRCSGGPTDFGGI
jgi:hypothetical protein